MAQNQYGFYAIFGTVVREVQFTVVRIPAGKRRRSRQSADGDKTGDDRWYETNVPVADRLFERHLKTIEKERPEHG
jgi:hypothetical protein